ncbi:MAG: hypothetical protein NPIRA03_05060 [Nitrospirales bacterium]|nr:MAG: hypothetical protein NPIRA03_05060 [Nitrospirales bacterium]
MLSRDSFFKKNTLGEDKHLQNQLFGLMKTNECTVLMSEKPMKLLWETVEEIKKMEWNEEW